MSLVSGPGRGGAAGQSLPDELKLVVEKHVKYIQALDTVRSTMFYLLQCAHALIAPGRTRILVD